MTKLNYKIYAFLALPLFYPLTAEAKTFKDISGTVIGILNDVAALLAGIALLVFLWGLAKFIFNAGNEGAVEEGKQLMIWGVVALFVMVSLVGILNTLQNTFFDPGPVDSPPGENIGDGRLFG